MVEAADLDGVAGAAPMDGRIAVSRLRHGSDVDQLDAVRIEDQGDEQCHGKQDHEPEGQEPHRQGQDVTVQQIIDPVEVLS